MTRPDILCICLVVVLGLAGTGQAAMPRTQIGGEAGPTCDVTIKGTGLWSRTSDDPTSPSADDSATGLLRARLDLHARQDQAWDAHLAYEHRLRAQSNADAATVGSGLPAASTMPCYRLTPLDWPIVEHDPGSAWRHEIDRALLSLHPAWGEISLGRQAIGLGRGRLFSAVDLFNPFSPAEIDREWRRGVDGARAEYRLADRTSLEALAVLGPSWKESALLGRLRGYLGAVDGELLCGKRGEDLLAAMVTSAAVAGAEVHAEAAVFHVPEGQNPGKGFLGHDQLISKLVLGASHTLAWGNGLTLLAEYHFSGFGFGEMAEVRERLAADESLHARFLRGDSQTLGRHNLGLQASSAINETTSASLLTLISLTDASGLISPTLAWDLRRNLTLLANLAVPWGTGPEGGVLRSEYGATPLTLLLQVNLYF